MNVSELARRVRVSPNELLSLLPEFGFDIGKKAIKIDDRTAQKIIMSWNRLYDNYQRQLEKKEAELKIASGIIEEKKLVSIPAFVSVRDFAAISNLPVNRVIAELMKNAIFVSLNERIDFETASIIGSDLNLDVQLLDEKESVSLADDNNLIENAYEADKGEMKARAPVIVVMGHVDHGKTKLLDAIRRTDVVAGEAGGITQHIGAYQVVRRGRPITFIDTPGHEAFTAMRSRGAKVADIAILVVAADDGVKPQTIEAFRIIESAKIPFLVAINKIDKPEANADKTKQELSSQLGIMPEGWGGKTICVGVSALNGEGVNDLLDMILLTADMEASHIRANPDSSAIGTIIESRVDKGEGPVATILVQNGTLRIGDNLAFQNQYFGKVRALKNYLGERIAEAGPSNPARIIGLKIAPSVGDILVVGEGEKIKLKKFQRPEEFFRHSAEAKESGDGAKKIYVILKADVFGSAEAIEESLEKINTDEVKIKVLHKGLGNISEGDLQRAEAGNAKLIGFHVKASPLIEEQIRTRNISVKFYSIIYDLINDFKKELEQLSSPHIKRIDLGKAEVMALFKSEKSTQIVGARVVSGKVEAGSEAEILRKKENAGFGKISGLKIGKENVREVAEEQECGLQIENAPQIEIGDMLIVYRQDKITNAA
jgi:translation initiation factor IF-2